MSRPFDTQPWPRRATFEHFRGYDKPVFSVCVRLDVTALAAARAGLGPSGLTLAYHHAALAAANAIEAFRMRLDGNGVCVHDVIHGSTTVLRPDESIAFAHLDYVDDFAAFYPAAAARMQAARRGEVAFDAAVPTRAMVYFTTLPWLDFTSFEHARDRGDESSVPRVAFGRIVAGEGGKASMAMAVQVHHALVDGLHVGRYVQAVQERLDGFEGGSGSGSAGPERSPAGGPARVRGP